MSSYAPEPKKRGKKVHTTTFKAKHKLTPEEVEELAQLKARRLALRKQKEQDALILGGWDNEDE